MILSTTTFNGATGLKLVGITSFQSRESAIFDIKRTLQGGHLRFVENGWGPQEIHVNKRKLVLAVGVVLFPQAVNGLRYVSDQS